MRFCSDHWAKLGAAIDARGLRVLVAEDGRSAFENLASEIDHGLTIDNFDPLMGAHNAIWSQAMTLISELYQQNPLMVMADDSEHPEWGCPICALNWCHAEHERLCIQEGCNYPKGYDWTDEMVNGASDFMLSEWKRLGTNTPLTDKEG
ncbi:MAG: hypothetical protein KGL39_57860 [Patescibacteria group bacterium]|nr:hypothetical protein [Patescibacteria group bacterium]